MQHLGRVARSAIGVDHLKDRETSWKNCDMGGKARLARRQCQRPRTGRRAVMRRTDSQTMAAKIAEVAPQVHKGIPLRA